MLERIHLATIQKALPVFGHEQVRAVAGNLDIGCLHAFIGMARPPARRGR